MEEAMGDHALQRCHDEMMNLSQNLQMMRDEERELHVALAVPSWVPTSPPRTTLFVDFYKDLHVT